MSWCESISLGERKMKSFMRMRGVHFTRHAHYAGTGQSENQRDLVKIHAHRAAKLSVICPQLQPEM